jgi:membrane-associated phospholipid phosphatase
MSVIPAPEQLLQPLAVRTRAFVSTFAAGIAVLLRPAKVPLSTPALVAERERLRVGLVGAVLITYLLMGWLDATIMSGAARLPASVIDTYNAITDYGRSSWVLWPSGVLVLAAAALMSVAGTRAAQAVLAALAVRCGFVFLAVGAPGLFVTVIKRWIGRARPSDLGPFSYHPFSWDSVYASLPSGHTAAAFSALIAIGSLFPRLRPLLWIYAITIAMSRVIIAAHFTSDVVAGAAVGAFGAILVREWFVSRRLGFYLGRDGKTHPMALPSLARIKRVARALVGQ